MNFLAKHFFDYQSFINLPHTAVQMHKTPPSQAGSDPSAAWAPKDLHIAGKNQAAPAARANRNYHGDQRTGSHRHGRPSKLEFRNWGERHGELREEKIVPHKDHWMEAAQNGHHHHHHHPRGGSLDSTSAILHGRSATATADHFPNEYFASRALKLQQQFQQQQQQQKQRSLDAAAGIGTGGPPRSPPIRALLILTVTPHLDFVSVTVKALRGLERGAKDPLVKLCLYDGHRLLEERGPQKPSSSGGRSSTHEELIHTAASADPEASGERQLGQSFLLKAPSPTRLPFCHAIISFYTRTGNEEATNFRIDNSTQLLGTCLIGPSGTVTRSSSHWRQMIKKMGVPVAMWHDLLLGAHNQPPSSASHCGGRNSPLEQRRRTATVAATSTAKHSATSSHAASSRVGGGEKPIDNDGSQERRDSSGVPVPGTAPKKESYPRKNGNESVLEMVV